MHIRTKVLKECNVTKISVNDHLNFVSISKYIETKRDQMGVLTSVLVFLLLGVASVSCFDVYLTLSGDVYGTVVNVRSLFCRENG